MKMEHQINWHGKTFEVVLETLKKNLPAEFALNWQLEAGYVLDLPDEPGVESDPHPAKWFAGRTPTAALLVEYKAYMDRQYSLLIQAIAATERGLSG